MDECSNFMMPTMLEQERPTYCFAKMDLTIISLVKILQGHVRKHVCCSPILKTQTQFKQLVCRPVHTMGANNWQENLKECFSENETD